MLFIHLSYHVQPTCPGTNCSSNESDLGVRRKEPHSPKDGIVDLKLEERIGLVNTKY